MQLYKKQSMRSKNYWMGLMSRFLLTLFYTTVICANLQQYFHKLCNDLQTVKNQ